jgi:sugar phosphate permease
VGASSVNVLIAKWFPISEKGTVVNFEMTGSQIGAMLAYPLASFACPNKQLLGGWPLLFYISGRDTYLLFVAISFMQVHLASSGRSCSPSTQVIHHWRTE